MNNEINAFELTDEQLDMVAGGKGNKTTITNTFTTGLVQELGISANTSNDFSVSNEGKKGGAGGAAQQSGSSISGIVFVGDASIK
jgi:hypothetical protein